MEGGLSTADLYLFCLDYTKYKLPSIRHIFAKPTLQLMATEAFKELRRTARGVVCDDPYLNNVERNVHSPSMLTRV